MARQDDRHAVDTVLDDEFDDWDYTAPAPRKRRLGRLFLILVAVLLTLVVAVTAGVSWYISSVTEALDKNIERIGDPFAGLTDRPQVAPAAAGAVNILLVGSDSRISAGDPSQWFAGAQRTDAIMLLHLPVDRSAAYVMSIPRDSWVDVPGHGKNKINSAFSLGGPALMIQTVEQLTDVRIDHFVVLDFEGFVDITDALGGVEVTVPKATADRRGAFPAGTYTMDGETALRYVRQRKNLPNGDFDRVKRQQNWIRAVARELLSAGTLTNPGKLTDALDALTKAVSTDDGFTIGEIRSLALESRSLRTQDLVFLTIPVAGTGRAPDGESIVTLDPTATASLWQALADDDLAVWVFENDPETLGETVR